MPTREIHRPVVSGIRILKPSVFSILGAVVCLFFPHWASAQSLDSFNPGTENNVTCFAVQRDDKILVGGGFTTLGGQPRVGIGRVNPDGTLDNTFTNTQPDGFILSLVVLEDGKILVTGTFNNLSGLARTGIARLNADGTPDATFNAQADGGVYTLMVQADGKIIVGGRFTLLGGQYRMNIGRLNYNGTPDFSFNPGADNEIRAVAVQVDGKILVGGYFNTLGGQSRSRIGRLNANGTLDSAFNAGVSGAVLQLAVQADGKILAAGEVALLNGQARGNIGRLNVDGTLDAAFNPGANGYLSSLILQTDGKMVVSGGFTVIGGQTHGRIARLNADGTADSSFTIAANLPVNSLALQRDGKILAGGLFTSLSGTARSRMARINFSEPPSETLSYSSNTITWLRGGSQPEIWRTTFEHTSDGVNWGTLPGAGERITGGWRLINVSLPAQGTLRARGYVSGGGNATCGWFVETYRGIPFILSQPASRTNDLGTTAPFRVSAAGVDSYRWQKNGTPILAQTNIAGTTADVLTVSQISRADEGGYSVVLSNSFGAVTSAVAMLSVSELLITTQPKSTNRSPGESAIFNVAVMATPPVGYQWYRDGVPLMDATNASLALQNLVSADAGLHIVVISNAYGSVTSAPAWLTVDATTLDATFNSPANAAVNAVALQADGKFLLGGSFTNLAGQARNRLARLNPDSTLDDAFYSGANGPVLSLALQEDGKILVGGGFSKFNGQALGYIVRLNPDGAVDSTFHGGVPATVTIVSVHKDGSIFLGGEFGVLYRLNTDGRVDTNFNIAITMSGGPSARLCSLIFQEDGRILVGGRFSTIGGQAHTNIARLNADGTVDATFSPVANDVVANLAVQPDGKILLAGWFTTAEGQARSRIARLNANGTLDVTFNPTANDSVHSLTMQADGKILVGGVFTSLGGHPREHIGRLLADGAIDNGFGPAANANVLSLALQADGDVLVGGEFTTLDGQPAGYIGRLNNTDPSAQSLDYDGTNITWLRSGTCPEVSLTRFAHTLDGLSWTELGAGARIQGGWQLTNVLLSPNGTLRARARVSGSFQNASSWFAESYLGRPVIIVQPASRTNLAGTAAFLRVAVGGAGPWSVQWFKNGTLAANQGNGVDAANNAVLNWSQVSEADEGDYVAVLSNASGSVTSAVATLTVIDLVILQQPSGTNRNLGESTAFNVSVTGTAPLNYQWYHNWLPVNGATGSTLALSNLVRGDAGLYSVAISNVSGSLSSTSALLTVNVALADSAFNPNANSAVNSGVIRSG